jgi:excisionase family DNA binding protein
MRSPRAKSTIGNNLAPCPPFNTKPPHLDESPVERLIRESFWTVKELAQYLHMSERWIHERTRRDEIPCHRLGTALRFDPREVHSWMIQRRQSALGQSGAA